MLVLTRKLPPRWLASTVPEGALQAAKGGEGEPSTVLPSYEGCGDNDCHGKTRMPTGAMGSQTL